MARSDTRDWAKARRERTRHLIELGGLVQKAGLVELVDDDRATLLGAFLELADQLGDGEAGASPRDLMVRWRRRGLRVFEADRHAEAITTAPGSPPPAPAAETRPGETIHLCGRTDRWQA